MRYRFVLQLDQGPDGEEIDDQPHQGEFLTGEVLSVDGLEADHPALAALFERVKDMVTDYMCRHDFLLMEDEESTDFLTEEYESWCEANGLPDDLDADSMLLRVGGTERGPELTTWLMDFKRRWDRAQKREDES